ncbi:MAG: prepilin-type N-terminal cleavage/methylation domain-containing protein [Candidatus Nealsonbacteria bacterium]|nr:prepilin-type N-terminal cleavage/methylation domain-containing protein [Candidatus Nealsonbacteria bacterium]
MLRGFTLIELMIVVGIVAILAALAAPALRDFWMDTDLENSAEEIINTLRLAQNKTIASEGSSNWGVYFSISTSPYQYTLFKGQNYLTRDVLSDDIHKIPGTVLVSEVNLSGGREAVFNRITGNPQQSGLITIAAKTDLSKTKTIYLEESGQAGLAAPILPSDFNRIKDSRHAHVDYSRYISTSVESLTLTFYYDSSQQLETIPIINNLKDGQIYWEGEFSVAGTIQKIKIHTHRLNDPLSNTQFSIHRDRRYNTKALKVGISGDSSGTIAEYSADGLNITHNSIYVTDIQWQ